MSCCLSAHFTRIRSENGINGQNYVNFCILCLIIHGIYNHFIINIIYSFPYLEFTSFNKCHDFCVCVSKVLIDDTINF